MTFAASVGDGDRLRLFLALRLPLETLAVVEEWQAAQLRDGRLVPREHLHVTLAFLGSRPRADLPGIVGALHEAARGLGGMRLEPLRWRETGSVGMIVLADPSGRANALATHLHGLLERLGVYRREARPWLPHLTVLRFRRRPRLRPPLPPTGTFVPSDAAAYLSTLHPSGARYEVLDRVSLTAGG